MCVEYILQRRGKEVGDIENVAKGTLVVLAKC